MPIPVRLILGFLATLSVGAAPVLPGLHGRTPLDAAGVGRLLAEELRCGACHEGFPTAHMKAAPRLDTVVHRVRPERLIRLIADPAGARPGGTMPHMMGAIEPDRRRETADDIVAFLSSLAGAPAPSTSPEGQADRGRDLFHSVGCVACHPPRGDDGRERDADGAVSLRHVGETYHRSALAAFLLDPLQVRPAGRMPSLKLTPAEAADLAAYLVTVPEPTPGSTATGRPVNPERVRAGREQFAALNCTACHAVEGLATRRSAPPRERLDGGRGCLSERPVSAPDFALSATQRDSIRAFLRQPPALADAGDETRLTLTRFNCLACHQRDGHGGVREDRERYFVTTEEGLGNDGKIPPPLTLAGAKLRGEWLHQVLLEGRGVRPYMRTRMPQFGPAVAGLPTLLARVDSLPEAERQVDLAEPDRKENRTFRDAARQLLGDKGLNCIACHNFNGKDSPGFKGLDLATSYQRLQPAWFAAYMKNPAAFRPGTVMPAYWPGGVAVQTEILGGDTDRQLRALWHYFSLGHSAADPPGIRSERTLLAVTNHARTYRGRNRTAGYRGIAVGFPAGLHYSFNAEYGSLAAVWRGEFIHVNWQGQGAGNFNPADRESVATEDVSLVSLPDPAATWPRRPEMTKEQPVNPDPLYPKNHGYAFRGYSLDLQGVPTFRYMIGAVAVRDRTTAGQRGGRTVLVRRLELESGSDGVLHFRPLVGRLETVSTGLYRSGRLQLRTGAGPTRLRHSPGKPEERELLIELRLDRGTTVYELEYELQD